jgi:hypothetical protein
MASSKLGSGVAPDEEEDVLVATVNERKLSS